MWYECQECCSDILWTHITHNLRIKIRMFIFLWRYQFKESSLSVKLLNFFKSVIKFVYSKKTTKFCKISTLPLSTVHSDKNKVEISQNFVAFSEYMNFKRWLKASLTLTCFVVPLESILLTFGEEIFQQESYRSGSYFITWV